MLHEQKMMALHEEISKYAAEVAGTDADLDETFEAAAVEHLAEKEKGS